MHRRRPAAPRMLVLVTALIGAAVAAPAGAQVLNFEGVTTGRDPVPIGNFYNGGAGPNYGVDFSSNAITICLNTPSQTCSNTSRGGRGDPTSQGYGLFFLSGSQTYMNRSAGFTNGFSFFYSAVNSGGSFSVYSGLNGTGTLLGTLALPTTPSGPGALLRRSTSVRSSRPGWPSTAWASRCRSRVRQTRSCSTT